MKDSMVRAQLLNLLYNRRDEGRLLFDAREQAISARWN